MSDNTKPTIDLSQFNHCHSTDPPSKRVLITSGEHAGKTGRLMGQWLYPYHLWTIRLDVGPGTWADLERECFVIQDDKPIKGGAS